jgi:uncharacterized protein YceK
MKKLLVVFAFVGLSGCASIIDMIPSRWDVNQSKIVTDIQQTATNFDCKGDQRAQLDTLAKQIQWFELYSSSKKTKDVANLGQTMVTTTKEFQERLDKGPVSPMYCELKKKLFVQQAEIMGRAVQGRF